jgi:FtsH-binding integral membrane protein
MVAEMAQRERKFFSAMGWGLLLIIFVGFSRSFYLDPILPDVPKPEPSFYYWVHGPAFTLWALLIAVQPWLIAKGNYQLHRTFGMLGVAVAISVVVTGLWGGLILASGGIDAIQMKLPPKQAWATPFFSMVTFGGLALTGFLMRKDRAAHKRAMILATFAILGAPLARWPVIGDWPPTYTRLMLELLMLLLVAYDWKTLGRIHRVTLWGALSIIVAHRILKPMIWDTPGWMGFTDGVLQITGMAT